MSLNKSILHNKEKRKPYKKAASFDLSCRPNGGCKYCDDWGIAAAHTDRECLIIAASLIVAEIERLDRIPSDSN